MNIIDIILVLLIVLITFIGTRRGFILTVFDLFSGIASFLIAKLFAPLISPLVYDTFAKKTVVAFLTEKYNGVENAITDAIDSVFGFLPDGVLTYCKESGMFNVSYMISGITTVEELEANVVAPVVTAVINIILFAVIAFIAVIVLRIVGRLISKIISKIKIVGKVNSVLGGVAGVLKGIVYVFIIAAVLSILSFASETIASYAASSDICALVAGIIGI